MTKRADDGTEDFDTRCTGTVGCDCPDCEESDLDDEDDCRSCYRCGGDGWVECHDPIECTSPHNELDECECPSCGGTGNARDMTTW